MEKESPKEKRTHLKEQASSLRNRLKELNQSVQKAENFESSWKEHKPVLLSIVKAEDIRIYRTDSQNKEIVAKIKAEDFQKKESPPSAKQTASFLKLEEGQEVRHVLSPSSLEGYTALIRKPIKISNVENEKDLASVHPLLRYNRSYDKYIGIIAKSVLCAPLLYEDSLFGVIEIVNKIGAETFTDYDEAVLSAISKILSQKINADLKITKNPFDYLIQKGKVTQEKIDELTAKANERKTWITFLLRNELNLSPAEIGESLEKYYGVPFMAYNSSIQPPKNLLKGISKYYLKTNLWIPIEGDPDKVVILISDPKDRYKIMEIQKLLNAHSYEFRVGLPEDILAYLGERVSGGDNIASTVAEKLEKLEKEEAEAEQDNPQVVSDSHSLDVDSDSAAVLHINSIILQAHKLGVSDIHIEPSRPGTPSVVRMRIDGACRNILEIPERHIKPVISRIKIMSGLDIAERRKPQDGKAKVEFQGEKLELRIATIPTVNGESAVLRLLASGSSALPFDKLNLSQWNESEIKRLIERPHGIFLVVGPTGSGKTTTLHAILGAINTPERKIWTAEDPVEITQPGLQQVQVLHKIGLTFAAVMRSFLRADPDVILIGEMRDFETANIGIEASLTGHLVFSTLHTNSAPETVIRLLDIGLDPFNFSDALIGVLAQRLVRTLCSSCKEAYKPTEEETSNLIRTYGKESFSELNVKTDDISLRRAVGCPKCIKTGYKGRTGIHEFLIATQEMKGLISQKATVEEMVKQAQKDGMRNLIQDGVQKILKGFTDIVQLHKVAVDH
ncbi:MAG: GspE/PulE family protein [Desulfobacterales bacterium]|nr:GspE/PulE family protein [Desulfobacterales bacterium]